MLNGKYNNEEGDEFSKLIENSYNKKEFRRLKYFWYSFNPNYKGAKSVEKSILKKTGVLRQTRKRMFLTISKYAAFVLLFISVTYNFYILNNGVKKEKEVVVPDYMTVSTSAGEIRKLTLSDSSQVWIGPMSNLIFPKFFSKKSRKVFLSGSAYFEVYKSKKRNFIVNTPNSETEVLGTHFKIEEYSDKSVTIATLYEGKVKFSDTKRSESEVVLINTKEAVLHSKTGKMVIKNHSKSSDTFKNNVLTFYNETLRDLKGVLERRYGKTIVFLDDEVPEYKYTGEFKDETPEYLLKYLKKARKINYKLKGDNILIGKRTK